MNRQIRPQEIPLRDRPISERFRVVGDAWADADNAASLLEELKTATLEQMKTDLIKQRGEMPDNRAERLVKSSEEWRTYINQMCEARTKANRLKVRLEALRMEHGEWTARDANARHEARLGRG